MGLGFDTALHCGTAIAIVAFFWRDWLSIISNAVNPNHELGITNNESEKNILKPKNHNSSFTIRNSNKFNYPPNLLWQILIASIPAAIAGYFLSDYVEVYLHSPILLAINLAVFGIILWLIDMWANRGQKARTMNYELGITNNESEKNSLKPKNHNSSFTIHNSTNSGKGCELPLNKIGFKQSLIVGLAQCLALIPGVSRSGITMTAGRSLGMNRENSARFSFILSAPITVAAFLFEARKVDWAATSLSFWLAIIVTVIIGLLTIKYLLKYLQRGSFLIFTVYRIALAIIIVVLFLIR